MSRGPLSVLSFYIGEDQEQSLLSASINDFELSSL